jgi:hypothetical protein
MAACVAVRTHAAASLNLYISAQYGAHHLKAAFGSTGNNQGIRMKNLKFAPALIAAFMLTTVVGCASTTKQESTAEYVGDSAITAKVKSAILLEPGLKSAEINVETFKGVVQLSGFVRSQENIATAISVARGVSGVQSVKNDMRLK